MSPDVTTYRNVRFAILALLFALAVSVVAETVRDGWQRSISAYYYTAAGPVFIAVLAAVGVCLVALRGYTDAEEVFLNLAGISAPMVAFVPLPEVGRRPDVHAIANSALTFFTVLAVGYVVAVVAGLYHRAHGRAWPSRWGTVGLVSTAAAWVAGVVWILADRSSFAAHAHVMATAFTFTPFVGVILLNTDWGVRVLAGVPASRTRFDAAYWSVLGGIVAVAAVFGALWPVWGFAPLAMEAGLLILFAVFWVLQTIDLWDPERDQAFVGDPRSIRRP